MLPVWIPLSLLRWWRSSPCSSRVTRRTLTLTHGSTRETTLLADVGGLAEVKERLELAFLALRNLSFDGSTAKVFAGAWFSTARPAPASRSPHAH